MIHTFYFSPSGTSKKIADIFADNYSVKSCCHDITLKNTESLTFSEDDIVLLVAPVYAGRIPQLASERFLSIKGNGQKAIVIAVYGNRDYDDALLELCDIAAKSGFEVIAAGAFIAQHCIFPKVANGRPDNEDELCIKQFIEEIKLAINKGGKLDISKVKGNRPYKQYHRVPIKPETDKKLCNSCGICAENCPENAIDLNNPLITDRNKCVSCCRCIMVCPQKARNFSGMMYKIAGIKFVKDNSRRKNPEWFV